MNNPTPTTSESDCLSNVIQLTHGFAAAGEAYFSRDMRWIILQAKRAEDEHYQMYLAQVKWSESTGITGLGTPVRISPEKSWNSCGYFSPDGNSIIFSSTATARLSEESGSGFQRRGQRYRWYMPGAAEIHRADGWQGAIAVAEPGGIVDLARHALTRNDAYDAEGAYSPDGKWIVFASNRTGDVELFAMRADGTDVVQLTHAIGYDGGPFFSPDGKRIVYRSDRRGNDQLQIFVADLLREHAHAPPVLANERQLTNDQNVNWGPYWHPDRRHIVYATSVHGHTNYEIYLMRADGTRKTRITFTDQADVLPVISPDGKYFMWASKRNGQTTQVYLARFRLPRGS
jgi:Tol biopolymer transport system component